MSTPITPAAAGDPWPAFVAGPQFSDQGGLKSNLPDARTVPVPQFPDYATHPDDPRWQRPQLV